MAQYSNQTKEFLSTNKSIFESVLLAAKQSRELLRR